jgi:hypothetical protein
MGKRVRGLVLVAVLSLVTAVATGGCTKPPPRKIAVGVAAYVWPSDDLFKMLLDPAVPVPEYVIVNIESGDGDVRLLDPVADALHQRAIEQGRSVKVLGYVWTSSFDPAMQLPGFENFSNRPEADIVKAIDKWLVRPETPPGKLGVHYDGIFFDMASPFCLHYDKFSRLRDHVRSLWRYSTIVHNAGMAVDQCFVEPGKETADIFGTFEGAEAVYYRDVPANGQNFGYWLGGNVRTNDFKWVKGDVLTFTDAQGRPYQASVKPDRFWHMLHTATPGRVGQNVDTARERGVGTLTISTAQGPIQRPDGTIEDHNAWIKGPGEPAHLLELERSAAGTTAPATTAPATTRPPVPAPVP